MSIEGVSEGVDGAAKESGSDWHVDDGTGSLDGVSLLDQTIVSENDDTDIVSLQVQRLHKHGLLPERSERILVTWYSYLCKD